MLRDLQLSDREQIADWIETTLLVRGTKQIGDDELNRIAGEEIGASPAQLSLARRVMQRRGGVLKSAYPFETNEFAVRGRSEAIESHYATLLLLTPGGVARQIITRDTTEEMEVLFERVTERAAGNLWGSEGRALRFGWPSDVGRPQGFNDAIEWLAKKIGVKPGAGYRPPLRKDGGVDVVAWRPFPDLRGGVPLVLVQCTLQSDIVPKASDVDTRVWASWLAIDFDPITALAVPQTIPDGVLWDQLSLRGMVLDRLRLAGLAKPGDPIQNLSDWNQQIVGDLSPHMLGADR